MKMTDQPRAWQHVLDRPIGGRPAKPRTTGLTMIMDKGLSLAATHALLETAGEGIDLLKLGFGVSALLTLQHLRDKIALAREFQVDVYPGGTLLEIAMMQNRVLEFAEQALELGIRCLEVSDGTVQVSRSYRRRLIRALVDMGFTVYAEVGKKHAADRLSIEALHAQIADDLEAGASKVIIEGRESGRGVMIYDPYGAIDRHVLEQIVAGVPDPDLLMWEAPQTQQMQALMVEFGTDVNLGNIPPAEALTVEALRNGLRSDTLRKHLLASTGGTAVAPMWPAES